MNFSTLLRHLREGFKNVFRNGWMSVASVMSIIVSLFILGVFMLLVLNVNSMANQVDSQVEISTFLELNVDENLRNVIGQEISAMPEVSEIRIVPKDEGLKEFRERLGENADNVLGGFDVDNNPLPDTIEVKVIEPETVNFVAQKIEALNEKHAEKPIMKVNYGKETVDVLFKFTKLVRNIGFIFVGGLGLMSMFLISNTIRVTILARRREIGIMKLVGATNTFIRWPFFIEGALIGLIGSVITVAVLFFGYSQLMSTIGQDVFMQMLNLIPLSEIWPLMGTLLIGLGVLVGILGSTLSIRKSLKV
ncbi:permease-like cell division protein FtsX [Paenibacillus polysaccharolyticus]|uniref:Cell division protein FtsX n=1 Tax=Paenibacillus polysaccharolyticus TaxID=582692 RepID=A0A1G5K899_9BACL|nr:MULTISPECIES: permease-like cell division protein FtsX [Paenibacillus]MCP1137485.1 permease-like cell division protein FtsX [Paenibacillus polysaccharolyticus]MDP9699818.1 cell division transport system permease protein [Paenibacillus intestini]SCY96471.1 cell division transport system permease protein [Paenibacillus polysaccharolyticus]